MNNRYFTKSAYKIANICPTQLYYCCDSRYANQNEGSEFLESLADGGFQVGELAKIYFHITPETTVAFQGDYQSSLEKTKELLLRDNVNIAEAAFRFGKCYVLADIIEKKGNCINLIEVKAKSFLKEGGEKITKKDIKDQGLLDYQKDVAFQKYVVVNALKELFPDTSFVVHAYLMMADKSVPAPVDGMNQFFEINTKQAGDKIIIRPGAEMLADVPHILTTFDVDHLCDVDIAEINRFAEAYCRHHKLEPKLSHTCFKCPFYTTDSIKDKGKLDGFKECWKERAGLNDEDFERPWLRDFSMSGFSKRVDELIENKKYFLSQIDLVDLKPKTAEIPVRRKLLYAIENQNSKILSELGDAIVDNKLYLNKDALAKYMSEWKGKKLHFIDFETSATALPFYKGMRPYESVAFQFSHHAVTFNFDGTYSIEHAGQFINTEKHTFPNFAFVRELRKQLTMDDGPIFRYASHENTILRDIREQLIGSTERDKDDLIAFIDSITHSKREETVKMKGERDMLDLEAIVKDCFLYPKYMKGRTSIKVVLPAVLNASSFLQRKYSKPIYGSQIKSLNYPPSMPIQWIKKNDGIASVDNPYLFLDEIEKTVLEASGFTEKDWNSYKEELGDTVANGGAALAAYSKLQFTDMMATDILKSSLLRYCELDTLAMVFIWEYFYDAVKNRIMQ